MNEQSVVGVYDVLSKAERAIDELDQSGFPIKHVSIVAKDLESEKAVHGYVNAGDIAKGGAGTGAWLGGFFGLLWGVAFLWVPGFGPLLVAGPLSAAILGGLEGAAAGAAGGGLLGALLGWGVSKKHILKYEEHVRGGKYLVIVHGTADQVERARGMFKATGAEELNVHRETNAAEPVQAHATA
ncbi:MAG: DUF1269 domain-containing protein [Phycisphaerae bacterium]|nr:DUF1269 domain-containing protein [Phycisphaerae bacterium]